MKKEIATGVVHNVPVDLQNALITDPTALLLWEDITPLSRNEWICWVLDAKKTETRRNKMECADLAVGRGAPTE
jgi:uncharacterized protein YdeI (YjbR/CyaY-like superfamily)